MKGDLVSVIVPAYNTAQYLERCINSIIAQTWKNIEIILINDGSSDSTGTICKHYKESDDRIVYIEQEKSGVAAARNAALAIAKGSWVVCVDSDDCAEITYIEKLIKAAKEADAELAFCNFEVEKEHSNNKRCKTSLFGKPLTDGANVVMNRDFAMKSILLPEDWRAHSWCKLFRMDIIKENDIKYREKCIIWEDYDFFFSYVRFVNKAVYVGESLYNHNDNRSVQDEDDTYMLKKKKIKSRYYAASNAERNIRPICNDEAVIGNLVANRVQAAAEMFLAMSDRETADKYLEYVKNNMEVFNAYSGYKNSAYNRVKRIIKHPEAMRKIFNFKYKRKKS